MMLPALASLASMVASLPSFAVESYCNRGKVAEGKPGMGAVNPVEGKTDPIEAKTWDWGMRAETRRRRMTILSKNGRTTHCFLLYWRRCHHSLGETVSFLAGGPRAGLRLARYSHMERSSH